MITVAAPAAVRSPYIRNPYHRPAPGDVQTPHPAECLEREGGLFPHPIPFVIDTALVIELRATTTTRTSSAILFDAVHLPTVRRRAVQHAEAYRRAAEALCEGKSGAPEARWYASQQSVAIRLAERILAEAKWTGSPDVPKPMFAPAGRKVSDAWAHLGAAYLWAARHLNTAASLVAVEAADELNVAASRLECAVLHHRRF